MKHLYLNSTIRAGVVLFIAPHILGCGGSSSVNTGPKVPPANLGGIQSANGTTTTPAVVPSTGGAMVATSINGQSTSVLIPSGIDTSQFIGGQIPANTVFTEMPAGQVLIKGNYGQGGPVSVQSPAPGDPNEPNPGPVVLNSGITVDGSGRFNTNVALPMGATSTSYRLAFPSVQITPTGGPGSLVAWHDPTHIKQAGIPCFIAVLIILGACSNTANIVRPEIAVSTDIPSTIEGTVPADGESMEGFNVSAKWGGTNNDGRKVTLKVTWPGVSLSQTQTIHNGSASFKDVGNKLSIPTSGLSTLEMDLGPPTG